MRTSQQPGHSHAANSPPPAASRITKAAALALTFFLLLGSFLSTRADPAHTAMLPLVLSSGSQTLAANNDHYYACGSETLTISAAGGVLANDTGPAPDELRAQLESSTTKGTLKLNEDGSFSYTPDPAFSGQDRFTYRAADNTAVSDPATVTLSVSYDPALNAPRIVTGDIAFSKQVIGTQVKRAHFAYAADFDEDGDLDVVATLYGKAGGGVGGMVLWYENDGANFVEKVLDPDLPGAYPAHVADVNCDGHIDVLAGGYDSDTFAWYRNDGANFTRINIDSAADGAHSIITKDLDNDGDLDLVTSGQDGNFISWYENDGDNNFQPHIIDDAALGAKRAEAADVDGDGDPDILGASFDGHEIAWYENESADQRPGPGRSFSKHVIDDKAFGAYYVAPADIDGDGDMDMFSANRRENTVAWYRNDGAELGSGVVFTKQVVDDDAIEVRTVVAVDLDRDGDVDGLAASVDDDTVAWHENDGAGGFTKHVIDDELDGVYSATAVDMDFDGDFDLLSAGRSSGEITLHSQYKAHNAAVARGGTLLINSQRLLTTSSEESAADLVYTISGAPKFGEIQVGGSAVPKGGTFSQQDIDDGRVSYAHTAANKAPDGFTFSVAGSGQGGVQPAAGTFTIKIN